MLPVGRIDLCAGSEAAQMRRERRDELQIALEAIRKKELVKACCDRVLAGNGFNSDGAYNLQGLADAVQVFGCVNENDITI